jgi:hypothetical protein
MLKSVLIVLLTLVGASLAARAELPAATSADEDAAYRQSIRERSAKIVASLDLVDSEQRQRVQALLESHYPALSRWHEANNARLKALDKQAREWRGAGQTEEAHAAQKEHDALREGLVAIHRQFIAALEELLPTEKVVAVKDAMTYGVAPSRLATFEKLGLSAEQRQQVVEILEQAREDAMMLGTAEEKHTRFRQAVGRINTRVLSAEQRDKLKQMQQGATTR